MAVLKIQFKGQVKILAFSPSQVRVSPHQVLDLISAEPKHEYKRMLIMQYLILKPPMKIVTAPLAGRIIEI